MSTSPRGQRIESLLPGQKVTIFRLRTTHRPIVEGRATIVDLIDPVQELYRVLFAGERIDRTRVVHAGDWQTNPTRLLDQLTIDWRHSLAPELLADFPPPSSQRGRR